MPNLFEPAAILNVPNLAVTLTPEQYGRVNDFWLNTLLGSKIWEAADCLNVIEKVDIQPRQDVLRAIYDRYYLSPYPWLKALAVTVLVYKDISNPYYKKVMFGFYPESNIHVIRAFIGYLSSKFIDDFFEFDRNYRIFAKFESILCAENSLDYKMYNFTPPMEIHATRWWVNESWIFEENKQDYLGDYNIMLEELAHCVLMILSGIKKIQILKHHLDVWGSCIRICSALSYIEQDDEIGFKKALLQQVTKN